MNLRSAIFLVFLFLIYGDANAQEEVYVEGIVMDSISKKFLVAVNIFDQETNKGTFSEIDGRFKIKIQKLPTTIIFSFIGYENRIIKFEEFPDEGFIVELSPSIFGLPSIEIIAEPKVEKLTSPSFTVKDFVIEVDKILLMKYGGIAVGNFLELRDLDGHVLHTIPVKVKGVVENMHQSCLGNIHLVGNQEVVEVDFSSGKIELISKYPKHQFERFLKPCVEASYAFLYYKRERLLGQQVRFDFISRKDKKIENSIYISDNQNLSRMREELGQYSTAESYYSAAVSAPNVSSGIARPEVIDAWIGAFYKPIFSPLYKAGKEICLFNHTLGFISFFSLDGEFLRQVPITYHLEKRWDKRILKDKKSGKFYTVYKSVEGKKFYEINLLDGKVSPVFKVDCAFVEKMVVHDGHLYYQDSGIVPGEVNRILHKAKVR